MTVETHEVILSFDRPGDARNPLLSILQQLLNRPGDKTGRAMTLLSSQKVLIVDSQQGRAQYVAHLLASAGYRPFVAPTSLDAYTLFLQGTFHPFVIILCEEGAANNQFFLTRLSQQFVQRYDWNVPFIRLQVPPSKLFGSRSTGPLAKAQPTFPRPGSPPFNSSPEHALRSSFSRSNSSSFSSPPEPAPHTMPPRPGSSSAGSSPEQMPHTAFPPLQPRTQGPPRPAGTQTLQHPPGMPVLHSGEQAGRAPLPSSPSFQRSGSLSQPEAVRHQARSSSVPLKTPKPVRVPTRPPDLPEIRDSVPRGTLSKRRIAPLPSASTMKFTKKQVEKISLDGLSIGRYQLQSLIGGNPIGDVYVTYDRLREQDIALKTLQTNMIPFHLMEGLEEDYNLFQQEMDLLQHVEHPHVSRVMNIGKSYISGFPFIYKTMPHYAEGSLDKWLNKFNGRVFTPPEVSRVILQVADALQFLHERGVLYQNFKQTNILIVNETDNMRDLHVVLGDLPFVQDVINLPKTIESYRYFAPEQWEGESFTSSDQYGLAILAYELLTGRAPFQGNSDAIMRRMHLTMHPPAPSSVNRQIYPFIDKVILRALAKRPEDRFESIRSFATALERASN